VLENLIHTVDIVIPVYNEEQVIRIFHRQLCKEIDDLPQSFSIYYINDGSSDGTTDVLGGLAEEDPRVTVVELSRNFGHQAALTAGLDLAAADCVITMDGDGQHPPEIIKQMLELADSGYDVVLTQRDDPEGMSAFKRMTSGLFYKMINRISETRMLPGGADFRLLKQPVVQALKKIREQHRFLRGLVGWMGFRTIILPYDQPDRLAGSSKYSLNKMVRLSMDALFSFSFVPLYAIISLGGLFLILAVAEVIYVLTLWVFNPAVLAPGWSSLMFVLLVVGGTLMVSMGFIGVYVGLIFQEVKRRPIYLVRRVLSQKEYLDSASTDS
jgi:polyisoprenyl-phosphate glycosyltransferase